MSSRRRSWILAPANRRLGAGGAVSRYGKRVASKVVLPKFLPAGNAVLWSLSQLLSEEERRSWHFQPYSICHGGHHERHRLPRVMTGNGAGFGNMHDASTTERVNQSVEACPTMNGAHQRHSGVATQWDNVAGTTKTLGKHPRASGGTRWPGG